METADREGSKRKVRGRKKTMKKEIMVNSLLTTTVYCEALQTIMDLALYKINY